MRRRRRRRRRRNTFFDRGRQTIAVAPGKQAMSIQYVECPVAGSLLSEAINGTTQKATQQLFLLTPCISCSSHDPKWSHPFSVRALWDRTCKQRKAVREETHITFPQRGIPKRGSDRQIT